MKQMVLNFLIFLLIVGAIYSLAYPDNRFAASASAIRQIWSGGCHLSCRQSEFSGFSGLSSLGPGRCQDRGCCFAHSSHGIAGPSSGCVCESCPCALIENVLRTCRPATTMYSGAIALIANFYYAVVETLSDMYNYMDRVLSCRTACQRPPQLVQRQDSSSENIYFGNKNYRDHLEKTRDKAQKSDSVLRSARSIVFRDISDTTVKKTDAVASSKPANEIDPKTRVSDVTLKPENEDSNDSDQPNSCRKCVEQGKVCMKICPKAYVKNK